MIRKSSVRMYRQESAEELRVTRHGEMNLPGGEGQVYDPFPASIRGIDAAGVEFKVDTILDSFSPQGLCVRLARKVREGARLFTIVYLSDEQPKDEAPLRVAVRGVVVKVERRPSQAYSVTVRMISRRLL